MQERILFEKCPLCDCSDLVDDRIGDCVHCNCVSYPATLNQYIQWKKCAHCHHIFTEGHCTDEVLQLIREIPVPTQLAGVDIESQRYISSQMVEKVLPYANTGYWLDAGFGNGSLLFTAQEYGFIPIGIDIRPETVNNMCSVGIQAHCGDVCNVTLDVKCAVASMMDVLEHIPHPQNALKAVYNLLADDGILFVSTPNRESLLWTALDLNNVNPYWGEIEHYHNFTRSRLYALLRQYGFEPLRYGISNRFRCGMEIVARKQH